MARVPGQPDESHGYRLGDGLQLVPRGEHQLQIGTDPLRRVLLDHPPWRATEVLERLDGRRQLPDLLADLTAGEPDPPTADPTPSHRPPGEATTAHAAQWLPLLDQLVNTGFVSRRAPSERGLGKQDERFHLAQRHGAGLTDVLLGRRADAIVQVRGAGRIATTVSALLASAGVGHLHLSPGRTLRPADLLPPAPAGRGPAPRDRLLERLTDLAPRLNVRAPATHQRPDVVVLAGDGPADAMAGRELLEQDLPHIAAWSSAVRAVVGPTVLPGLSSCLWCAELTRTDADSEWPRVRRQLGRDGPPPAVLAVGAAALTAADVLNLVDGLTRPLTVDGTVEWDAALLPRRRSWSRHPGCPCHPRAE